MLFFTTANWKLSMPPPSKAVLPDSVLLVTVSRPARFKMPPPSLTARLPDRVLFVIVSVPKFAMPPPSLAELPDRVLLVIVSVPPKLPMPPPSPGTPPTPMAELPDTVLLVTVSVPPSLRMPPPLGAELRDRVLLVIVSVPLLKMPPPEPPGNPPFEILRPLIDTVTPDAILNTWNELLPLTVSTLAPGPFIVTSCVICGRALPSVIVPVTPAAKLMVSAPAIALASTIACRSVPVPAPGAGLMPPLSPVFVTVNVAALARLVPVIRQSSTHVTTIASETKARMLLTFLFIISPVRENIFQRLSKANGKYQPDSPDLPSTATLTRPHR